MKKRILIDVDDVICENHFFESINEYLEKIGEPIITNFDAFDRADIEYAFSSDPKTVAGYLDYFVQFDSYKNVKPLPDAINGLKILNKHYDIFIVTNCIDSHNPKKLARQFTDKFYWLLENLPFIDPSRFIMTAKKDVFKADVIIDDRLGNLKGDYSIKLLFSSFHNKNLTDKELNEAGAVRVSGWDGILEILKP